MKTKLILTLLTALSVNHSAIADNNDKSQVYQYLEQLANPNIGIGAREAGTKQELHTADYLVQEFKKMGYKPVSQAFLFGKDNKKSANIIIDTNPSAKNTIILGAHYDSTGAEHGSLGAMDNGAGVAAMMTIAKNLSQHNNKHYNFRFIAFGAEETGLQGSKYYVEQLRQSPAQLSTIKAMINFDTIAGGDIVYVHSAHTKPYQCVNDQFAYNSDIHVRNALLNASEKVLGNKDKYTVHPAYPGYPEGVTGPWSDHSPFACAGVPIAYVEATNFTINGEDGYDGYSQTLNKATWNCFDEKTKSACDRDKEAQWGKIWHTQFDTLATMNKLFPGRVAKQLDQNVAVLTELFINIDNYLK